MFFRFRRFRVQFLMVFLFLSLLAFLAACTRFFVGFDLTDFYSTETSALALYVFHAIFACISQY